VTNLKGKTPTLISGSSGNPSIAEAKKKRECKRCKAIILLGDTLFEIPKTGGFTSKKSFCMSCFNDVLDQTQKDLDNLKTIWKENSKS
jgi:hypothetical protein